MFSIFLQITTRNNKSIFIILFILICALGSVLWISQTNPGISIILLLLLGYLIFAPYRNLYVGSSTAMGDNNNIEPELNVEKSGSSNEHQRHIAQTTSTQSDDQQYLTSLDDEDLIRFINENSQYLQ